MIIIDSNNLCHIAYHSTGDLSWEEMKTGVIFGFLRNILTIATKFKSDNIVLCWDSRKSLRRKVLYVNYKSDRKKKYEEMSEAEIEDRKMLNNQMSLLRNSILPELGFKNNFMVTGFEADDLIAKVVESHPSATIISTDKDLYQLLVVDEIKIYNPITKKTINKNKFIEEYNIGPEDWVDLKSIMGDKSDSIDGIPTVGRKIAWRYITDNKCPAKHRKRILEKESQKKIDRNRKLIKLPFAYKGLPKRPTIVENNFNRSSFINVFDRYRFISFLKEKNFSRWEKAFYL